MSLTDFSDGEWKVAASGPRARLARMGVREFEHARLADAGTVARADADPNTHPAAVTDRVSDRSR